MDDTQITLRESLSEAINAVESVETPQVETPIETKSERVRDDDGKFSKKDVEIDPSLVTEKLSQTDKPIEEPIAEPVQKARPSTWKKDYWEKFDALDPELQNYINQRETEYKTGVSVYKNEAESARSINEALTPLLPDLQRNNIQPSQWIKNMGTAHQALVYGSPDQKLQVFAKLAKDYGVDINNLQNNQYEQQQIDPNTQWLTQQVQGLSQTLNSFKEQQAQQEQAKFQTEVQQFAANNPHYEAVRLQMAQLLETGMANDLQGAYDKAVRLNDDTWQSVIETKTKQQSQTDIVNKAKSAAVSTKSSTPSGTASNSTGKGLREQISDALDAASSRV